MGVQTAKGQGQYYKSIYYLNDCTERNVNAYKRKLHWNTTRKTFFQASAHYYFITLIIECHQKSTLFMSMSTVNRLLDILSIVINITQLQLKFCVIFLHVFLLIHMLLRKEEYRGKHLCLKKKSFIYFIHCTCLFYITVIKHNVLELDFSIINSGGRITQKYISH